MAGNQNKQNINLLERHSEFGINKLVQVNIILHKKGVA